LSPSAYYVCKLCISGTLLKIVYVHARPRYLIPNSFVAPINCSPRNVYVADTGNHCVRRVSPSGVVATVAGQCGAKKDGYHDG